MNNEIQAKELFEAIDFSNSGVLSYGQICQLFKTFDIGIRENELVSLLKSIDYNRKGGLSLGDFEKIYKVYLKERVPKMFSMFSEMDSIVPEEVSRDSLRELFPDLAENDVDLVIEDLASSGGLSRNNFISKIKPYFK